MMTDTAAVGTIRAGRIRAQARHRGRTRRGNALVASVALGAAVVFCCGLASFASASGSWSGALDTPLGWTASTSASVSVPPDSNCPESHARGGAALSVGLGANRNSTIVVDYGQSATLSGYVSGPGGLGISGASVCIYSSIATEEFNELIGLASTNEDGRFEFPIPSGPSRNLTAVYRSGEGQLTAWSLLQVRAFVTLHFPQNPVHNKHFGYFTGHIAGPDNDGVIVILQVKAGRGWLTFSRYSTRNSGKFIMRHHFTRTFSPTTYVMRAQVAGAPAYPYLPGNSAPKELRVLP